jgi:predicted alpha/beta-hydrolase family hydrolase
MQFLFAHGAGAPMDSPFMETISAGLASHGIDVVRFEFPYMAARRSGARKPPDRERVLLDSWRNQISQQSGNSPTFIGGKSMGGRIASMIADDSAVDGLICFGYPFHPPGKPAALRTRHLETLRTRALIIQGTRDSLGNRSEMSVLPLSPSIRLLWIEDGDHSLKPRRSSGRTEAQNLDQAIEAAASFMAGGNSVPTP